MADEPQGPILNDEIRSYIGMESDEHSFNVPLEAGQNYAIASAVGEPNPLYLDEEAAKQSLHGGLISPYMYFQVAGGQFAHASGLRDDGIPTSGGRAGALPRPPIPLPRVMAGGTEVEYVRPVRPGERLTGKSRIADITEREGRTGPLVFQVNETTYRDDAGKPVVIVRSTTISR
jgi:acyl dehydratase